MRMTVRSLFDYGPAKEAFPQKLPSLRHFSLSQRAFCGKFPVTYEKRASIQFIDSILTT